MRDLERPYILNIQQGVLSDRKTTQLRSLLADYLNQTKLPLTSVDYTLSNCSDRETDCTCDKDD